MSPEINILRVLFPARPWQIRFLRSFPAPERGTASLRIGTSPLGLHLFHPYLVMVLQDPGREGLVEIGSLEQESIGLEWPVLW
jgi:hypothetical protein